MKYVKLEWLCLKTTIFNCGSDLEVYRYSFFTGTNLPFVRRVIDADLSYWEERKPKVVVKLRGKLYVKLCNLITGWTGFICLQANLVSTYSMTPRTPGIRHFQRPWQRCGKSGTCGTERSLGIYQDTIKAIRKCEWY